MSAVYLRKYATGTGADIDMPMVKRGVVDYAVGADWTPAAGDVKVSIDGGAAANIGTLPTAVAMGNTAYWKFVFSNAELTGKRITVTVADSATKAVEDQMFTIETYGNVSAMYPPDFSDAVRMGLTALPNVASGGDGSVMVRGATQDITFQSVSISNPGGTALSCVSTGGNGHGINALGNGSGSGFRPNGGATGDGIRAQGGGTGGHGINALANNAGQGIQATGAGGGDGINAAGQGSGRGLAVVAGATGIGALITGGATSGAGVSVTTTSGDGLSVTPTAGNAIVATANGTSKHGAVITGGTAGTSDGIKAVAGTGGVDVRGNITGNVTGNLSGSAGSVTGAVGSVTGNVGGNVVGSVASVTAGVTVTTNNDKTGYALSAAGVDAVWDEAQAGHTTAGTFGKYLDAQVSTVGGGTPPTAAEIADAVWDEARAGHVTAGTFGEYVVADTEYIDGVAVTSGTPDVNVVSMAANTVTASALAADAATEIAGGVWDLATTGHTTSGTFGAAMNAAGSAGDPWATSLPGAYGAGTAGKIVGDNLNATVGSRSSHSAADVWAVATRRLSDGTNIVLAKGTGVTGFNDLDAAGVRTAVGLASANLDTQLTAIDDYLDTEVAAIKAKTDNLPAAPAATGDIPSAATVAAAVWAYVVENSKTALQYLRVIKAASAGKLSGAATTTVTIRDDADTKDRITATVDADGNRSAVTIDGT
jgi:hypothetical protein